MAHGPKIAGCAPLGEGELCPHLTVWPGPRPTFVPSFILIRLTVWPQYTNVTDRTGQTIRTVLQTVAQKYTFFMMWFTKLYRLGYVASPQVIETDAAKLVISPICCSMASYTVKNDVKVTHKKPNRTGNG